VVDGFGDANAVVAWPCPLGAASPNCAYDRLKGLWQVGQEAWAHSPAQDPEEQLVGHKLAQTFQPVSQGPLQWHEK